MVTLFLVWFWVVLGAYRHPFLYISVREISFAIYVRAISIPDSQNDLPCWEKQLDDGWAAEKKDNEEQNVSSLDFDGLKKSFE